MVAVAARRWTVVWAPMRVAALAFGGVLAQLRGVDLPAQLHRIGLFHREGVTLWDSQWQGTGAAAAGEVTMRPRVFGPISGVCPA